MSTLTEKIAAEHGVAWIGGSGGTEVFGCVCGHRSTNTDEDDPFSATHNRHVAEVMEAAVRKAIATELEALADRWSANAARHRYDAQCITDPSKRTTRMNTAHAYRNKAAAMFDAARIARTTPTKEQP